MSEAGTAVIETAEDKFDKLIQLLTIQAQTQKPLDADALAEILDRTQKTAAGAMQKALRPENDTHPGLSVYSHPEGDRSKPKPPLPFELFWNNYPVHKYPETESWREWELLAQLTPGEYTVLRKDGTRMTVSVAGERDADGKVTKLMVTFPIQRAEKELVPPKSVLVYQMLHNDNPKQAFVEAMHEHLDSMLGGS